MASKKTKKRRDKKSRLSDKDILKLIKKLRPKNQQIVRVNVGDKADKKKGSTSAFQPNIVPVLTYAAPFQNQPPPPPAPPLPPPLPVSQQAQLQPLIFPPPAPTPTAPLRRQASLLLTDTEAELETPVKTRKSRTSRKALETAEQGYSVQPAREPRFKAPKGYVGSSLSASSSQPTFFQPAVQNDPFLQVSFEDPLADEAGVVSQPLPSDEWTGTPQGEIETETMAGSASALELPPATESSTVQKIKEISQISSAFGEEESPPPSASSANPPLFEGDVDPFLFNPLYENLYLSNLLRDAPLTAQGLMKNEIVEKLKGGYTGVPKEYLTKTGRLKTKISANELYNLYTSLK